LVELGIFTFDSICIPSGNLTTIEIIEIVDLPMKNGGSFHRFPMKSSFSHGKIPWFSYGCGFAGSGDHRLCGLCASHWAQRFRKKTFSTRGAAGNSS